MGRIFGGSAVDPFSSDGDSVASPNTDPQISDQEEIFRAFFNANRDDYMAYWGADLELKVANFQLDPCYIKIIEKVRKTRKPARFEADQGGNIFDFRVYPALNALGECAGIAVYAHDTTLRKEAEEKAHRLTYFDPLTGLPNRSHLLDRLHQAITAARRHSHAGAILLVNLNRFKYVNDSLGHGVGDTVLRKTADRLQICQRDEDTVARMGGDEFAWLLPELDTDMRRAAGHASRASERLLEYFEDTITVDGQDIRITPSIGIALFGDDDANVQDIFKQADAAMHRAKNASTGHVQLFRPQMQQAAMERLTLETKLHQAVDDETLELHFQPQARLVDGSLIGAETLLRWTDSTLGNVSPAKFIPIAEETGLVLKIGAWVLETACRQIHAWNQRPGGPPLPRLAVNISPMQFRQVDFVSNIRDVMERWEIGRDQLELELTEGIVIEQVDATIQKMKELRALGVRFAIDDFGTGYSSLSYLNQLPLDILKIDQSFVRNIGGDSSSEAIVASIVTMAHLLNFELIAEGVEETAQLEYLRHQGCHTYQGYLFSRPLPLDELERFISAGCITAEAAD